jgi:hypothetical protein
MEAEEREELRREICRMRDAWEEIEAATLRLAVDIAVAHPEMKPAVIADAAVGVIKSVYARALQWIETGE